MTLRERLGARGLSVDQFCKRYTLAPFKLTEIRSGRATRYVDRYAEAVQDALGIERAEAVELLMAPAPPRLAESPFNRLLMRHSKRPCEVAQACGLSRDTISGYSSGRVRFPRDERSIALAAAIGCTVRELRLACEASKGQPRKRRTSPVVVVPDAPRVMPSGPVPAAVLTVRERLAAIGERIRIESLRAYEALRALVQSAIAASRWLEAAELRLVHRLEDALEIYQKAHRLEEAA